MADVKWTREQLDAIEARGSAEGGSFLISAAAGSGKTAVLVQRAIGLLTDPVHPVQADRLLVVTFTRAAAAEMRARLEKRLYALIRENPGSEALRRQSILLSQASIGTMHSFCADTIRNYFHELDISPEFKIITEKQEEALKRQAVEEAIGEMLSREDGKKLADAFSGDRDDGGLTSAVLELFSYMSSHPFPRQWLSRMVAQYETGEPAGESPWGRIVLRHTRHVAAHCLSLMERARETATGDEPLEKAFFPLIDAESRQMGQVLECAGHNNWQQTYETVNAFSFARLTTPRGYKDDPLKLHLKALRGLWKDIVEKKLKLLFPIGEAGCREEFAKVGEIVKALAELTLDFAKRYSEKKAEKDFFDYNDLEHQMIRLVTGDSQEEEAGIHKTPAAYNISEQFDEIMIDEFQDINAVQELIFKSVSRDGNNLFMVGDVKQSIYGFRRAMPEIFIRTRDGYDKYDREKENAPAYIVLGRNFRSRRTVTESVNFVFSQIMRKETGDLDYNSDEELVYGADYPEKAGCETELHFIARDDMSITETEGRQIAARIWEMINSGFTVTEQGQERPAEFRDFCVLLRSANAHAHDYAVELQKQGIPAKATLAGGFFAAREVGVILSFLRVISNPDQDIPLMTVLMSPIYGFTPDDLLALRQENPGISLYLAFLQAEKADGRYRQVAHDIAYYRAACVTMPSDGFIELLYRKTGYADMVLAMRDGGNRLANLQLLQKYAGDYEQSGYHGIAGFVRFMDRLKESRADLQAAEQGNHVENSVRIMSVHKSKGLEFPVCFVAGCDRGKGSHAEQVLLHPELGLGIMLPDRDLGVRYRTVSRAAVNLDNRRRESAEEMRILYVAMTRAREKLILISAMKKPAERLEKLALQITPAGMSDYAIENAKNFAEWLMLCALRHPNGGELREIAGADASIVCREFSTPWQIELEAKQPEPPPEHETLEAEPAEMDVEIYQEIKRAAAYRYPYQVNSEIPSKVTASGMAAKTHETRWRQPLARPAWLGAEGLTPAERGTALHDYMQYADFHAALRDPQSELTRLMEMKFLSPEQGAAVELVHVQRFLQSELGKRVLHAQAVEKERRFTVEVPAEQVVELTGDSSADTKVVLQGAVDCTFVEDGKIHIIDFKTDRVKAANELAELYRAQIMLYAQAMEQVTGLEVGDCVLYSMYLDQAVRVEFSNKQYRAFQR